MSRIVHTSRSLALLAGLVVLGGVAVAPAMAGTVTYSFSGVVGNVGSALFRPANPAPFNTGALSAVSGTIVINSSSDDNPSLIRGEYDIQSMIVQIGNHTVTLGAPIPPNFLNSEVTIRNGNGASNVADRFLVDANATGAVVRAFAPRLFSIDLQGPNGAYPFVGDAPYPGPSIGSFTTVNSFRLQFGPGNQNNRAVTGFLTSLTAVPLPPAVILFGVGLVALIGLGAGGLRNLRLPQA